MPAAALNNERNESPLATVANHPDIVVMVLAFPIFIAASLPLAAYALAVGVWFVQALIIGRMNARAAAAEDPKAVLGYTIGGFIARAWIAAAGLVIAAVAFDDRGGLAAALLLIALFTAYFLHRIFTHAAPGGTRV